MHLNNGLDIPPRNRDILETSILEILRTYNASMWLAGPGNGEGNFKDTLVTTPLALVSDPIGYVQDSASATESENFWSNSTWAGAPAPATPTNLIKTAPANGITTTIVSKGTDEFGPYVDIGWSGTGITSTMYAQVYSGSLAACGPGEIVSMRTRHQIISGSVPPNLIITVHARDVADVYLGAPAASYPALTLKEEDSSGITPANTAKLYVTILNTVNVGVTVDCVLRVWYVQVNKGRAQPHLPTSGSVIQRADPFIPLIQSTTGFKPILAGGMSNELINSRTLSSWSQTGPGTVTLNAAKALDGSMAATVVKRTGPAALFFSRNRARPGTAALSFSGAVVAKPGIDGRFITVRLQGVYPAYSDVMFDMHSGTVVYTKVNGGMTLTKYDIKALKDGYWLCRMVTTDPGGASAVLSFTTKETRSDLDAAASAGDESDVIIDNTALGFSSDFFEYPFPVNAAVVQETNQAPYSWGFDGVDDRLAVIKPTIPDGAVSHFRIIALKMPPTAPGTNQVAVSGASAVASVRLAHMTLLSGGFNIDGRWVDGAGATAIPANHTRAANEKLVVRMSHVAGTYTLASKGDIGAAQSTSITPAALAAYTATGERIGCSYATGVDNAFSSWEIYGIISGNGTPTPGELLAMENFLAGHAGFTPLP